MDDDRIRQLRDRLLSQAEEIRAAEHATSDARTPVKLDQQAVGRLSRMDAMQVQAMAMETSRRRSGELRRIAAALARMDTGDYGYCLECGEEIAVRRLELDPATPRCVRCASGN